MHTRLHGSLSILFFSLSTIILLSVVPSAYAGTLQPDNYPGLPDAFVNYNSVTNESTITWDFSGLPDYADGSLVGQAAKCAIKADFGFSNDPEDDPDLKINGFMARYYSPTYDPSGYNAAPTYDAFGNNTAALQSTDNSDTDIQGEEIPCTGELTINFDDVLATTADTGLTGYNQIGHANNIATYVAVEPFISFYIMTSNGDFQTGEHTVIDEVFILYHPQATVSQTTIDWACGANDPDADNQIAVGFVLFIDQSGIRGTGGPNNCNTVQELEDSEFCCIFITFSTSDSGGCDDCIDPTFYYSQNRNIVQDGFRYNTFSTNVTGNLHTDIPLLFTYTNYTNFLTLKVYDNFGTNAIKWIDVGFGSSGPYDSIDNAEVKVEAKFSDSKIIKFDVFPDNQILINFGNATSRIVDCGYFGTANCLQITIPHRFNEELAYPGMVIYAEDHSGNEKSHYLNDGIEILGESLNEPPIDKIFIQKYLGDPSSEWVDILRIDRVDNIWSSEDGIMFKGTDGAGFQRITPLGFDNTLID